jgi:hypothetical protein
MSRFKIFILFFLVVVSLNFFESKYLTTTPSLKNMVLYFRFLCLGGMIALSVPFAFRKSQGFVLPIQLLFLSMLISIFMAYSSWDQSVMKSTFATVPYMLWLFFFYLLEMDISIKAIEDIVLIYGGIYIVLFLYQFTHSAVPLFGGQDEFVEARGVVRIIFPGGGVFYLASFIAINKLTTEKRKWWLWIGMSLAGLVCTVMQVTRQAIFGICLLYFYHLIKGIAIHKKLFVIIICLVAVLFVINSDIPIVKGITEAQKSDTEDGKNYIRIVAANYFLYQFSPNNVSRILGNGVPYALDSNYALFVANLKEQGFFLSDVGIIAMYVMFGVLSVLAYLLIWIKSFLYRVPKQYYYVKYYLWYLLITCATSNYIYDESYIITTIFALYIFQVLYEESKVPDIKQGQQEMLQEEKQLVG